ncbi:MAG TPA: DUF3772 domain-containing protein [Caulobacteraceae bacterium]
MRLSILVLVAALLAPAAWAQTPAPQVDPSVIKQVSDAQAAVRADAPPTRSHAVADDQIKDRLARLPPIQTSLAAAVTTLTAELTDIDARLAGLGPPPGPGQPPEAPLNAASRRNLLHGEAQVNAQLKQARLLLVEATQADRTLVEQLHENFSARLWTRTRSILDLGLWVDVRASLPEDLARLQRVLADEQTQFAEGWSKPGRPMLLLAALVLALLLVGPARLMLNALGLRRAAKGADDVGFKSAVLGVWLVAVAMATPLFAGLILWLTAMAAGVLTEDVDELTRLAIRSVVFACALEGLGRALLSPGRRAWRLAPIGERVVARVAPYPGLLGAAAGLTGFVAGLNANLGSSFATSVATDCITVLLELAVAGGALLAMAGVRRAALPAGEPTHGPRWTWTLVALAAWLSLAIALLAVLFGYLALAAFLMRETLWIVAVLGLLFLGLRFCDEIFPAVLSDKSGPGRALRMAIGFSEAGMEQIAVLASGVCRIILLAIAWAAIVAPFGTSLGDVATHLSQTQFSFKIGQVLVTPGAIIGAAAVFLIVLTVTRAVRGWLDARYLPKTRMDIGARNSVGVAVSYGGAIIGAILGFASLGLSFSQIALFASALSVGIGFGLQAIIGNFVSGLILLAERPVRVGDWVALGDLEGDVKAINVRATEIEMPDRSRLIVPNSDLVSKVVRNVTNNAAIGRVRIVLKIDDAADPAIVRDLILTRLTGHADVLAEPPPAVYLSDVREGALEFTAFAFVGSPRYAFRVKSDLLFGVVADLKAARIALATPATVVNVGLPDPANPPEAGAPIPEVGAD